MFNSWNDPVTFGNLVCMYAVLVLTRMVVAGWVQSRARRRKAKDNAMFLALAKEMRRKAGQ